jgi:hypothetical protein
VERLGGKNSRGNNDCSTFFTENPMERFPRKIGTLGTCLEKNRKKVGPRSRRPCSLAGPRTAAAASRAAEPHHRILTQCDTIAAAALRRAPPLIPSCHVAFPRMARRRYPCAAAAAPHAAQPRRRYPSRRASPLPTRRHGCPHALPSGYATAAHAARCCCPCAACRRGQEGRRAREAA